MPNYLVSVWMVTYNHEKYIAQALESVLIQKTSFDFEIVIGEDCSTDSTRSIVKHYESKYPERIHAIYHETNVGGMRNAYEFTLPACKGKYIACLEGDDYWTDPNKLQKQVDFLEKNPEYGLVFGNQYHLGFNGKLIPFIPPAIATFENILFYNSIPTATTCFRKSLINQYTLETSSICKNWILRDYPMWLWIYQNSKIQHLDDFFAVYRKHEGSATDFSDFFKGESFYLSVINIKTYFYSRYYKGERPLLDFLKREYSSLFTLSIEYRKTLKCIKYFPFNAMNNLKFVSQLIKNKFYKYNDLC